MPFIDEDEVIPFEGVDGDRLVPHLVLELVNVQNLDPLTSKQARAVLLEQLGGKPGGLELTQMLLTQALVRGQKDDPVKLPSAPVLIQIKLVLGLVFNNSTAISTNRSGPFR